MKGLNLVLASFLVMSGISAQADDYYAELAVSVDDYQCAVTDVYEQSRGNLEMQVRNTGKLIGIFNPTYEIQYFVNFNGTRIASQEPVLLDDQSTVIVKMKAENSNSWRQLSFNVRSKAGVVRDGLGVLYRLSNCHANFDRQQSQDDMDQKYKRHLENQ